MRRVFKFFLTLATIFFTVIALASSPRGSSSDGGRRCPTTPRSFFAWVAS